MRSTQAIMLAVALGATSHGAAQTIESRLIHTQPVMESDAPFSVNLILQARVDGETDVRTIGTVDYRFTHNDSGSVEAFQPVPLSINDVVPQILDDAPDSLGCTGMYPEFRALIGNNNDDPGSGVEGLGGSFGILPLHNVALGADPASVEAIRDGWTSLYKMRWTTDDLTRRSVRISVVGTFGGYFTESDGTFVQPLDANGTSLTIVVPAPATASLLLPLTYVLASRRRREKLSS